MSAHGREARRASRATTTREGRRGGRCAARRVPQPTSDTSENAGGSEAAIWRQRIARGYSQRAGDHTIVEVVGRADARNPHVQVRLYEHGAAVRIVEGTYEEVLRRIARLPRHRVRDGRRRLSRPDSPTSAPPWSGTGRGKAGARDPPYAASRLRPASVALRGANRRYRPEERHGQENARPTRVGDHVARFRRS